MGEHDYRRDAGTGAGVRAAGKWRHGPPAARADEPILTGFLVWRVAFVSTLLLVAVFGLFLWERRVEGGDLETARTVAVNMLVAGEIAYLFNSRFLKGRSLSWEGLTGSRPALLAVGIVIAAQIAYTYWPPMAFLFKSAPLTWTDWAAITVCAVLVFLVVELEKAVLWRRSSRND